jgi:CBS domain-containing protein
MAHPRLFAEQPMALSGTMRARSTGTIAPMHSFGRGEAMQIERILRLKGQDVATVTPTSLVADAARALAQRGVGALVVSSDGDHIEGIISERDITHAVGLQGSTVLDRRVDELMTRDVTTCSRHDTVDHLAEVMTTRRVRHLPVVEDGRLAGIVSIGDVVKHRLDELQIETQTLHEYIVLGR